MCTECKCDNNCCCEECHDTCQSQQEQNTSKKEDLTVDYKALYIQSVAEFTNYKRRQENINEENVKIITHATLTNFLPIYYDAKRGLQYGEQGCNLIFNKLLRIIQSYEVNPIDENYLKENYDNKFSDDYCVAVGTENTNDETLDNTISKVIEDGFIDVKRKYVITHAKVIVYKFQ